MTLGVSGTTRMAPDAPRVAAIWVSSGLGATPMVQSASKSAAARV
ncbi:hypothetical protein OG735_06105 [Streptomyces sp. NBC_01210]|nr:hypothetical protein OG735_06105 [Streptomyces sp. NBC_01210]